MPTAEQSPTVSPCTGNKPLVNLDMKSSSSPPPQPPVQTPKQQQKYQTRVRFFEENNQEHVFERIEYIKEEVFYSAEEFAGIKKQIFDQIQAFQKAKRPGQQLLKDYWKWRGFEHIPEDRSRKQIRRNHAESLLRFHQFTDPVGLAIFASTNSKGCARRARELALFDEQEAFQIYHHDDDDEDDAEDYESDKERDATIGNSLPRSTEYNEPYVAPRKQGPLAMYIRREDSLKTGLLEGEPSSRSLIPLEQEPSIASWLIPYRLVMTLLPCAC